MNSSSCKVTYHATPPANPKPGDLWCDDEVLRPDYKDSQQCCVYMVFPDGSHSGGIMVYRDQKPKVGYPSWRMVGTPDKPETFSLHPSLHLVGYWHGWLRNGRLESC